MAKREKEGEMNEGAEGGWVESGMNEQRYSETPSRGLIQSSPAASWEPEQSLPGPPELR